ncbi:helix-turn-helix domain-containing protein [Comamonas thiooxydans]|uniref:helix-turn-helix domain-containing protein n=1 Tax=Comamonas thiooxydans TaxID=363952 RepID=UPI00050F2734|nr:helix-turn-helix domain-containing protein [Comamonas thiooxydans]KGH23583.1 hypothetical protein P606_11745 [Comamonas thiooxydans]
MSAPTQDLCRKFDLIFALATIQKPDIQVLQRATDIPVSTLKRQLSHLRTNFGIHIEFQRTSGTHGGSGHYAVTDWGMIEKERFLAFWLVNRPKPEKIKK